MTQNSPIDLSQLPAPSIVEVPDFEALLAERLADLRTRDPEFDALVESDPAYKILEEATYREVLLRQRCNDVARSCMLAFATGTNLDHLGALFNLLRNGETDAQFRRRIQLAMEGFSTAGPKGAYEFHALNVVRLFTGPDGVAWRQRVKAVSISSSEPGQVDVAVLAAKPEAMAPTEADLGNDYDGSCWGVQIDHAGGYADGTESIAVLALPAPIASGTVIWFDSGAKFVTDADAEIDDMSLSGVLTGDVEDGEPAGLLPAVDAALDAEEVRPLCDTVVVRSATIVTFTVNARLTVGKGPDAGVVESNAAASLEAYLTKVHAPSAKVAVSALHAALHVEGVSRVELLAPGLQADLETDADEAPFCTDIGLEVIRG